MEIPNWLTSIEGRTFYGCSSLTSVEIPNFVTSIGKEAFRDCYSLTSVEIGNSVTSIRECAFYNCTSLAEVKVLAENPPSAVKSAFDYNNSGTLIAKTLYVPTGTKARYEAAYVWKDFWEILEFEPEPVEYFQADGIYYHVTSEDAKTVEVTHDGKLYDNGNPVGNSYSGNVMIPSAVKGYRVTAIGERAFWDCSSLTSVEIPNSVTSIGERAFWDCTSLTSVEIPNSVTSIGNWAFAYCRSLTSVEIGNSVTSIGERAFSWCSSLEAIEVDAANPSYCSMDGVLFNKEKTILLCCPGGKAGIYSIPNSVTSIGEGAFCGCSSLTSVEIPESVTSIGGCAFSGCSSLTSVEIPNSVTSIGEWAFSACYSLTEVKVLAENPPTIEGSWAFDYSSSGTLIAKTLYVPTGTKARYEAANVWKDFETIVEFEPSADEPVEYFQADGIYYHVTSEDAKTVEVTHDGKLKDNGYPVGNCYSGNVMIPSAVKGYRVTAIGEDAFYDCSSLTSVEIPNSVTSIGERAFWACRSLTSVEIPNSVTSIGGSAFYDCLSLTSVEIPNSVTSIGESTFSHCESLTSVEIGNSVTSIGSAAFFGCRSLTSVEIPNSVTSIGDWAFSGCRSLTSVEIPESVTSIGGGAFYGCSSLTSVVIPNSVTSIGSAAFCDCSSLAEVKVLAENPPTIESSWAFDYSSSGIIAKTLYVPTGTKARYEAAEVWKDFETIVEFEPSADEPVEYFQADGIYYHVTSEDAKTVEVTHDGKLYDSGYTVGNCYSGNVMIPSAVKGYRVTAIGEYAFSDCRSLTSVEIPNSVTSIGERAFRECKQLSKIIIPDNVIDLGFDCFAYCDALKEVTIGKNVQSFDQGVFWSSNVLSVYSKPMTPPSHCAYLFSSNPTIHVYSQALTAYLASDWPEYGTIVGDLTDETEDIKILEQDKNNDPDGYNLFGVKIDKDFGGIGIRNGKKVLIK